MRATVLLLCGVLLPGALSHGIYSRLLRERPAPAGPPVLVTTAPMRVTITEVTPAPGPAPWEDRVCTVSEQVTEALTATRLDRLRIRAGAGSLEVRGVEGGERVVARAWLCASDRERLFAMDVDLRRLMGPDLLLETRQADPDGGLGWGDDEYARIDLVLEVPAGMAVAIEDGSGTIAVNGVGDLLVRDGSGDVDVRDVRGNARIEDGSGGVRVARVSGDVEILDGTGSVEVGGVTGSLVVSGATEEVSVADVAGEVRVPEGALGRGVAEAIRRP